MTTRCRISGRTGAPKTSAGNAAVPTTAPVDASTVGTVMVDGSIDMPSAGGRADAAKERAAAAAGAAARGAHRGASAAVTLGAASRRPAAARAADARRRAAAMAGGGVRGCRAAYAAHSLAPARPSPPRQPAWVSAISACACSRVAAGDRGRAWRARGPAGGAIPLARPPASWPSRASSPVAHASSAAGRAAGGRRRPPPPGGGGRRRGAPPAPAPRPPRPGRRPGGGPPPPPPQPGPEDCCQLPAQDTLGAGQWAHGREVAHGSGRGRGVCTGADSPRPFSLLSLPRARPAHGPAHPSQPGQGPGQEGERESPSGGTRCKHAHHGVLVVRKADGTKEKKVWSGEVASTRPTLSSVSHHRDAPYPAGTPRTFALARRSHSAASVRGPSTLLGRPPRAATPV